jgi:hypothetical protein
MTGNSTRRNGMRLQPRDLLILTMVALLRVADREQIRLACGFGSTTRVNARLILLVRAGLLRRYFLGRGAGRRALYAVSEKGAALVGKPLRGPRRRQNETLVADFYVEHQLAVNEVHCALAFRELPGVRFRRWMDFDETIAPSLRLIPDGYVELETPSGIVAVFLEVDLGTESLGVWKEKVRQYIELAATGEFAKRFGQSRFRVLVLAHSLRRLRSIQRTVAASTQKIFWFATLDDARERFFSPVWLRPISETPQPFIEAMP